MRSELGQCVVLPLGRPLPVTPKADIAQCGRLATQKATSCIALKAPFLILIGAVPWFSEPDAPGGIGLASPPFLGR
jgi:hypothetical protein